MTARQVRVSWGVVASRALFLVYCRTMLVLFVCLYHVFGITSSDTINFVMTFMYLLKYCWHHSWPYSHLTKPLKSMTLSVLLAYRKHMIVHDFRIMFRCSCLALFFNDVLHRFGHHRGIHWHQNQRLFDTEFLAFVLCIDWHFGAP